MSSQSNFTTTISTQFYSLAEVALILGVSQRLVLEWIHEGRLPVFRFGPQHRLMRVRLRGIAQWVKERREALADLLSLAGGGAGRIGTRDARFFMAQPGVGHTVCWGYWRGWATRVRSAPPLGSLG